MGGGGGGNLSSQAKIGLVFDCFLLSLELSDFPGDIPHQAIHLLAIVILEDSSLWSQFPGFEQLEFLILSERLLECFWIVVHGLDARPLQEIVVRRGSFVLILLDASGKLMSHNHAFHTNPGVHSPVMEKAPLGLERKTGRARRLGFGDPRSPSPRLMDGIADSELL